MNECTKSWYYKFDKKEANATILPFGSRVVSPIRIQTLLAYSGDIISLNLTIEVVRNGQAFSIQRYSENLVESSIRKELDFTLNPEDILKFNIVDEGDTGIIYFVLTYVEFLEDNYNHER